MVAAPDGRRWVVEARRPRLGEGSVTLLAVRTLAGAVVWRAVLAPDADAAARVAEVARAIEAGGWPGDLPRPTPASYWSPTLAFLLWLVLLTPLTLLAWISFLGDDAGAAWPVLATVVWAGAGVAAAGLWRVGGR